MKGELLFLGTGGSTGIPQIGCSCEVCQSTNPKNKRLRPSVLLTIDSKKLLVDVGPDFRYQALKFGITKLDGVLITHTHSDHIAGLDELRIFYLLQKKSVPILISKSSFEEIKKRLSYLFQERKKENSLPAQLDFHILKDSFGEVNFLDLPIKYTTYQQGGIDVTGFRFNDMAYVTDLKIYPNTIFDELKGVKVLIMSALKKDLSPMHLSFEEAIAFSKKVGAKETIFMHMGHEVEHETMSKELQSSFSLAYDGMKISF